MQHGLRYRDDDYADKGERAPGRTRPRVRCRVEPAFVVIRRLSGFATVRYRAWRTTRGAFRRLRPGQPFHEQAPSAAYGAGMAGLGSVRGAPEARKPPAPPAMAAETPAPLQLELGNLTSIVISPSFPARPSPRGASVVSVPRPRHA